MTVATLAQHALRLVDVRRLGAAHLSRLSISWYDINVSHVWKQARNADILVSEEIAFAQTRKRVFRSTDMRSTQTAVAVAIFVTLAGTLAVAAQEIKLRTVHGKVVDEDNRAVASAIVYLRDERTNSVRTYITDSSGRYRFSWHGQYDDYDVEAQSKNFHSHRHTISQWNTRGDMVIDLRLDKKQG